MLGDWAKNGLSRKQERGRYSSFLTSKPAHTHARLESSISEITRIVLDCDYDKISLILAQADEVGLLTDYHNYLGKESNRKLS